MKRSLLGFLVLISLFNFSFAQATKTGQAVAPAAAAVPAGAKQASYSVPIVTKTLANGLEVIVLPDSTVPLVTVELSGQERLIYRATRAERPLASFRAHVL